MLPIEQPVDPRGLITTAAMPSADEPIQALVAHRITGDRLMSALRVFSPPSDMYERARWTFLLFSLLTAFVLFVGSVDGAGSGGLLKLLPAVAVILLGARWMVEYAGDPLPPAWDVAEAVVIFGLGVATRPIDIIILVYARLSLRALEVRGFRLLYVSALYVLAFAGSALVSLRLSPGATSAEELFFLASGFPLATIVMRTIGAVLIKDSQLEREGRDRELDRRLSAIVEHTSDVILLLGDQNQILYSSPSLGRLRGDSQTFGTIGEMVHPEDLDMVGIALRNARQDSSAVRVQFRLSASDGAWRYVEAVSSSPADVAGIGGLVLTARDVTTQREVEQTLRQSEANFRLLFANNPQPMWVYDLETLRFLEVNLAATAHYGYTRNEFLSMTISDINPEQDPDRPPEPLPGDRVLVQESGESKHRMKDGRVIHVDIVSHQLEFGGRMAALVLAQDVTERRELDEQLRHQAFHDALTGLSNRALFRDRAEQALAREARTSAHCAVLFIDLDNFKAINDSVGHTIGDAVLMEVARRLRRAMRPSDTAARLGGDEFGVLLEAVSDNRSAIRVAQRVANSLKRPIEVDDDVWFISASIGIAFSDGDVQNVDALMQNADVAMYDAKRRGRGEFTIFEPAMRESVLARLTLEGELRTAISSGQLVLAYQPQLDLKRQVIVAVEALVRWNHPRLGLVSPAEFISLAEESGLIEDLDSWVLAEAAGQARAWNIAGIEPIVVGVNVSGKEFANPALAERIAAVVAQAGVEPHQIELEVTESVAFEAENARSTLVRLREMGFKVAIDDFGVGFSMLGRLQELPVDRIKIDRSFIEKITFGEDEAPIVTGIIAMAHSLRVKVVAEGIETSEQLAFLRRNGCDHGQGHRLGHPMPAAEIERLLSRTPRPLMVENGG
jgi:diguanylate cyclase (GGDEF)-like protein/PAS domain S-box-containing protein